jgi:hypothetical protein
MAKIRCRIPDCRRRTFVKVIPSGDEQETVRAAVEAAVSMTEWRGAWRSWLCPTHATEEGGH